ncbi:MAG: hypothetical protein HYR56_13250 [Acidobacteria bacterium]|nr:hypothetical protein [Acidobacteriota bacterium]MBI3428176.1 hypothetical protein [Acidobacteriota bacterium]
MQGLGSVREITPRQFCHNPGFTVGERNYHTATEELELALRNASADPFWRGWGSLILVETNTGKPRAAARMKTCSFTAGSKRAVDSARWVS